MTMFLNPGIIPNYLIVSELGLLDSVWALVLPNAIWTFELLILKSFYENMSESLREAPLLTALPSTVFCSRSCFRCPNRRWPQSDCFTSWDTGTASLSR